MMSSNNPSKHSPCVGIRTCSDYSPFGVALDGRTVSGGYRYGFQNQEKDDQIKGEGNSINYIYRMHDSRLGRFFTVDPLSKNYPHNSTYAFSENIVVNAIELEGLEKVDVYNWAYNSTTKKNEMKYSHTYTDNSLVGDYKRVDDYNSKGKVEKTVWKDANWKNTTVVTEEDLEFFLGKPQAAPVDTRIEYQYTSAFEYSNPLAQEFIDDVVPDAIGITVGTGSHAGLGLTTNVGLVLFTKGPDIGFHPIHVMTAGLGLEANLSINVFAGYYNGVEKNMKDDFGGTGYQIGGDFLLGGSFWGSQKPDGSLGWFGGGIGLGLSGGSSGDVTKTNFLNSKNNVQSE